MLKSKFGDKNFNFNVLYSTSRDGYDDEYSKYFDKCTGKGNCVVLIKNATNGFIFGGFRSIPLKRVYDKDTDPQAFLFKLSPDMKVFNLKDKNGSYAIHHYKDYGVIFGAGHDIILYSNKKASCSPSTYNVTNAKDLCGTDNKKEFTFENFEVIQVTNL